MVSVVPVTVTGADCPGMAGGAGGLLSTGRCLVIVGTNWGAWFFGGGTTLSGGGGSTDVPDTAATDGRVGTTVLEGTSVKPVLSE